MKQYKDSCSLSEVKEIEFDVDTIFIRTNIHIEKKLIDNEEVIRWRFDEIQINLMEFVEMLNSKVDKTNSIQEDMIVDNAYRVALLELSAQGISL